MLILMNVTYQMTYQYLINHDSKKQLNHNSSVKSIIMLDEIEDGINPHHSEKLIGHFKKRRGGERRWTATMNFACMTTTC